MSTTHHLPLDRRTLHGHFSRDLAAVITVDRGDSVEFEALDSGWHWDLDRRAQRVVELRGTGLARRRRGFVGTHHRERPRHWHRPRRHVAGRA